MIDPNDLSSALRGILLLHKSENLTRNVLAMLGLAQLDFGGPVRIIWDTEEITVEAKPMAPVCTCLAEPKDPKVYRVKDDLHSTRCHLAMWDHLIRHPWLVEMDSDDDQALYSFQWPRDISAYRATIQATFGELDDDALWANFQRSWQGIVDRMPEPRPSLADRTMGTGDIQEQAVGVEAPLEPQEVSAVGMDFGDLDFDALPAPADAPTQEADFEPPMVAILEQPHTPAKRVLVVETTAEPGSELTVVHGAGNPAVEAAAQAVLDAQETKRGRGRPKGTGKHQKARAIESDPGAVEPEAEGQPIPACKRFALLFLEEIDRLTTEAEAIGTADKFPIDQIRDLKTSLDRMALRAAHLEFRGAHNLDDPSAINPLIEVSLANVTAQVNAAVRDLGLAPEKPKTWEDFQKNVKEAVELSKDVLGVMSQMGAAPAIQESAKPAAA